MLSRVAVLGALLIASPACTSSTPGLARTSPDNPLVSIGAGEISIGVATRLLAWYVIDRRTQTCWMSLGELAPLDCCALRRVTEARPYLTWTRCPAESSPSSSTLGSPAPDAPAPAASPDAH